MSYRSFKHLLGETSLERKCRFIFGGGILVLVTFFSFYLYGQKAESLLVGQTTQTARMLVKPTLMNLHYKALGNSNFAPVIDELSEALSPLDDLPRFDARIWNPYELKYKPRARGVKPSDLGDFDAKAVEQFLRSATAEESSRKQANPHPKPYTFRDGTPMWADFRGRNLYQYAQAVLYKPSCLMACHPSKGEDNNLLDNHMYRYAEGGKFQETKVGDLAGVVVIDLPMLPLNYAIQSNRAMLITAALITAILAMIASWTIVRYVIVKPVKHLRDVSDAIAAGKLTVRAQIQTGDEFEELSHAFNRMLHNLVAMQQELREVNGDLDRKVDELAQANLACSSEDEPAQERLPRRR